MVWLKDKLAKDVDRQAPTCDDAGQKPDPRRAGHDGDAPDASGRPPVNLPPFAPVLRTSLMPSQPGSASASPLGSTSTAVCCASSTSNSSPKRVGRSSFFTACSSHGNSRRLAPSARRARLTLKESVNFCSCASSTCAIDSKSHRIASGTWTRQLCAWFQQASVDGQKKAESVSVFASRAFLTVTLAANMRGGMWTQIVYEGKSDRVHPHGPHFPRQLVSHSPTHWITQDAPLDMIDAIDTDMHARLGWSIWTLAHRCSDSCCSHSCTQQHRTQTARNTELPAGASSIGTRWSSVSFSQKQNAFWRRENCFHEAQPRSLTHQMPRPKPPTASQRRT